MVDGNMFFSNQCRPDKMPHKVIVVLCLTSHKQLRSYGNGATA